MQSPIIIQPVDGKASALAVAKSSLDKAPGGSYILITRCGEDRTLRSMNRPQLHRPLLFNLTERERETLYAHASEAGLVQIAKK